MPLMAISQARHGQRDRAERTLLLSPLAQTQPVPSMEGLGMLTRCSWSHWDVVMASVVLPARPWPWQEWGAAQDNHAVFGAPG